MKQVSIYTLKVWLTTIVIAPIIVGFLHRYIDPEIYNYSSILVGLLYCVPAGIIFCLPSWLLFWKLCSFVNDRTLKTIYKKLLITIPSVFLSLIPWLIINAHALFSPNYWPSFLPWVVSYSGVLIACVWIYKLAPVIKP